MSDPVRLGVIGTGIAARDLHWPALSQLGDSFEIVAICNRTRSRAESFAELTGANPRITTDYRELLSWPEVEAVDIVLPIALNAEVTIAALEAGKHVIVEKPIAAGLEGGFQVVAAAAAHPRQVLLVAENIRYDPRFTEARRLIDEGQIGRPVMLHADVLAPARPDSPYALTTWRITPQHLGGYLSDGGVHAVASLHMLGGRIDEVQGLITSFHPDIDPTDTLLANLRFVSGAVGHLTYSVGVSRGEPGAFRVYGTDGVLAVMARLVSVISGDVEKEIDLSAAPNPFLLEFEDFHRAIVDGTSTSVQPRDALDDLRVIDAAFRSSRDGNCIYLTDPAESTPPE